MDIAVVAVISSATVGAIGVMVPALTRRRDRAHEVLLEKLRGQVSRTEWVRDHQAEAYSVLQQAAYDHRLLDHPPEVTSTLQTATDTSSEPGPSSCSRYVDEVIAWSRARQNILEHSGALAEVWMSARVASAWSVLSGAAAAFDAAHITAAYAEYEGASASRADDAQYTSQLSRARHEVILRIALDLQGLEYWAGIDPSDFKTTPAS